MLVVVNSGDKVANKHLLGGRIKHNSEKFLGQFEAKPRVLLFLLLLFCVYKIAPFGNNFHPSYFFVVVPNRLQ